MTATSTPIESGTLELRREISEEELQAAIKRVCQMSSADFFDAAISIGLDPWSGMPEIAKVRARQGRKADKC